MLHLFFYNISIYEASAGVDLPISRKTNRIIFPSNQIGQSNYDKKVLLRIQLKLLMI